MGTIQLEGKIKQIKKERYDDESRHSRSPKATGVNLGPPNNPGFTPASWAFAIPFSSEFLGACWQKGVLGVRPPASANAFRGCFLYAMALSVTKVKR